MQKKMKVKLMSVIVVAVVIVGVFLFIPLDNPLSNLGYVNEKYGFGLNPPEGWTVEDESTTYVFFGYSVDDNITRTLSFSIHATILDEEESTRGVFESTFEPILNNSTSSNVTLISYNERTVNDMEAYEIVAIENRHNFSTEKKLMYVGNNKKLLLIQYVASPDLYNTYDSVIEQSLNSLVIV